MSAQAPKAFAEESSQQYPSIVEKLAAKFNLNKDELKAVFEEDRNEHEADRYALWVEKLDQLVADGKLTGEQKDAIIAKYDEMHDKRLDMMNMDPEERKETFKKLHDEVFAWAQDNGIDPALLGPFAGKTHMKIGLPGRIR